MNGQMEICRVGSGREGSEHRGFCPPRSLGYTIIPKHRWVLAHEHRNSPNPTLLGFITYAQLIKSLAVGDSTSNPSLFPGGQGVGAESSNPLMTVVASPGNHPKSLGAF